MLAWTLVHATASVHNAIASVRHGAFMESVEGTKRFEHRRGGVTTRTPDAERDVREYIAYYPATSGQILEQDSGARRESVDMRATIAFNPPFAGPLRASRVDYVGRLAMPARSINHFDQEGVLAGRDLAKGPWIGLQAFLWGLAGEAISGPLPSI